MKQTTFSKPNFQSFFSKNQPRSTADFAGKPSAKPLGFQFSKTNQTWKNEAANAADGPDFMEENSPIFQTGL